MGENSYHVGLLKFPQFVIKVCFRQVYRVQGNTLHLIYIKESRKLSKEYCFWLSLCQQVVYTIIFVYFLHLAKLIIW
jgi:hypothetical protein